MLNHNIIITSHLINTRFKLPKHCAQSSQFMIEPHKYYAQSSQPLPLSYTSLHCTKLSFQAYVNLFNESLNESIHTLLWIYSHIIVNLFTMLFMGLVNLFTHYCESIHNAILGSVNLFTKCCESIHSAIHEFTLLFSSLWIHSQNVVNQFTVLFTRSQCYSQVCESIHTSCESIHRHKKSTFDHAPLILNSIHSSIHPSIHSFIHFIE